jgi:hypothetical protein
MMKVGLKVCPGLIISNYFSISVPNAFKQMAIHVDTARDYVVNKLMKVMFVDHLKALTSNSTPVPISLSECADFVNSKFLTYTRPLFDSLVSSGDSEAIQLFAPRPGSVIGIGNVCVFSTFVSPTLTHFHCDYLNCIFGQRRWLCMRSICTPVSISATTFARRCHPRIHPAW